MNSFGNYETRGITDEEREKFWSVIKEKAPNFKCACCGSNQHFMFESSDFYNDLAQSTVNNITTGEPFAAINKIILTCTNCSHMHYFNAKFVGL